MKIETTYKLAGTSLNRANSFDGIVDSAIKRGFDILASILGLLLLSPVFLIVVVMLKRDSQDPILFRGKRAGKDGKEFKILKFRTMMESSIGRSGPRVTARDDDRITPLGRWLRDTKINELPQLWNVLIGDMSMVGPRPEDYDIAMQWPEDAKQEILSVRPGITSPASVIYRDEEKMLAGADFMTTYYQHILPDKMRLDRIYVRHHTILGDIDIIFWTLAILLPRIASIQILEGSLFGGPISRFVRFNIAWFVLDFVVAFVSVGIVGVIWRTAGPINLGLPRAILFAIEIALAFGVINAILGLNSVVWSRAVPEDLFGIIFSSGIVILATSVVHYFLDLLPEVATPMLLFIGLVTTAGFVAARYRWRLFSIVSAFWLSRRNTFSIGERVLIVGTGQGNELASWLLRRDLFRQAFSIIGVVDDDPLKQGMRFDGAWVIGTTADISVIAQKYDIGLIMLAVSDVSADNKQRIFEACIKTNIRIVLVSDMMRSLQTWLTESKKTEIELSSTIEDR